MARPSQSDESKKLKAQIQAGEDAKIKLLFLQLNKLKNALEGVITEDQIDELDAASLRQVILSYQATQSVQNVQSKPAKEQIPVESASIAE